MLGEVLELTYGCDLTIGPALEEGFYYDCFLGERSLTEDDCRVVEKAMEKAVKAGALCRRSFLAARSRAAAAFAGEAAV